MQQSQNLTTQIRDKPKMRQTQNATNQKRNNSQTSQKGGPGKGEQWFLWFFSWATAQFTGKHFMTKKLWFFLSIHRSFNISLYFVVIWSITSNMKTKCWDLFGGPTTFPGAQLPMKEMDVFPWNFLTNWAIGPINLLNSGKLVYDSDALNTFFGTKEPIFEILS